MGLGRETFGAVSPELVALLAAAVAAGTIQYGWSYTVTQSAYRRQHVLPG